MRTGGQKRMRGVKRTRGKKRTVGRKRTLRRRYGMSQAPRAKLRFWERLQLPAAVEYMRGMWPHVIGRPPPFASFKTLLTKHHAFWGSSDKFLRVAYSKYMRQMGWA
jgi:hypothetical protein